MSNWERSISRHCHACKKYLLKKKLAMYNYFPLLKCRSKAKVRKEKLIIILIVTCFVVNYVFGITEYAFATSFSLFSYPLHIDVRKVIEDTRNNVDVNISPLNKFNYEFRINNIAKCQNPTSKDFLQLRLLFVVKSAVGHHALRDAIRKTWGFESRFSDVPMRTIFVLGTDDNSSYTQQDLALENSKHRDIIQGDFIDSYFNNTLKTMMSLKWAMEHCKNVNVFAFIDDDYYVSSKKLLKYLRNPFDEDKVNPNPYKMFRNKRFYGGYVFPDSVPQRVKFSKWYITHEEYPYARWPPYVTGGAFLLSYLALEDLVLTSYYTKIFRFDDVFLGILAKRAGINLTHIENFRFWESQFFSPDFSKIIAAHGFSDPNKLIQVWYKEKTRGNT